MISVDDDLPSTRRVPPLLCVPLEAAPDDLSSFSVELRYVEPGHAAATSSELRTYTFRFAIHASSPEAAVESARARFDEAWRASGVGWERRITEIRILPGEG